MYPSEVERDHMAGVTELYKCGHCNSVTRFPRFNAVTKCLTTRRGRCGEYSILMLRMLKLLNWDARWVVDWADHVWTEVKHVEQWIHIDPCEAAVNENYLYQSWGKNQTFVLALSLDEIHDVTNNYTTDITGISLRRESEGVNASIITESIEKAKNMLMQL